MTIIDIVKKYLLENKYDGLCDCENECGCRLDDLAPCGEMSGRCEAGHLIECNCGEGCDYHIAPGPSLSAKCAKDDPIKERIQED